MLAKMSRGYAEGQRAVRAIEQELLARDLFAVIAVADTHSEPVALRLARLNRVCFPVT